MNILMICKGHYHMFMPIIADVLQRRYGHTVSAMTFATRTTARSEMRVFTRIYNLAGYLKEHVPGYKIEECVQYLQHLELSGQTPNLNLMAHSDRILTHYSFERLTKILAGICRFWSEVLHEANPDTIVGEVACAAEWIAWSLAQQRGVQYLIPYGGAVPKAFHFVQSPTGAWESAEILYRKAKKRGLSLEQSRVAGEFLSTFRATRLRSSIHAPAFRSPVKVDSNSLKLLIQRAKRIPSRVRTYWEDGCFEVGSYSGTPPWQSIAMDLLRVVRHVASRNTLFDSKLAAGKKVYFPLHVQPEFTIDVRAPFYTNQLALIQNIAKSLPSGYRLVVKDHPGMRGRRSLKFYREIRRLYNVQLLSPGIDSHEIIKSSDAILTITGTTAWEGILYQKPVIAFGPLGYGFFDLIYHCATISELPSILSEAVQEFKPDRDLLLKFISSTLESAHRAEWHDPLATPSVLDPTNIDNLAGCIESEIQTKRSRLHCFTPVQV